MTKKNIIVAIVSAVVLGALLGLLIGVIGGFFGGSDQPTDSALSENRTTVQEEQQKQEEDEKAAQEAAKDAVDGEDSTADDQDAATDETTGDDADADDQDAAQQDQTTDNNVQTTQQQGNTAGNENTANAMGTGTVYTGGSSLNLRADASTSANIVGSLSDGETLTIIGESNGMYQVQTSSGATGWVSSQFVAMN